MLIAYFQVMVVLCVAILPSWATAKQAPPWQGTVVHVTDGDTLWVQPAGSTRSDSPSIKIRLDGIDAPEICQTYGRQSALALQQLIGQKIVTVTPRRRDDYGREVAKITFKNEDIGAWMVSHGHAWSYHYRHSAGPYAMQERIAQSARLGLFADNTPLQPSVFRKTHGSCYAANGAQRRTPRN